MSPLHSTRRARRSAPPPPGRRRPSGRRGSALVIALLMMLLVTLLGVSMIRSTGVEVRMVGNASEKQHAFQVAQTALQWGEWWLTQAGNATTGGPCATAGAAATPQVCGNAPAAGVLTTLPWAGVPYYIYTPPAVNGVASLSTSGGFNSYYAPPQVHVAYLGSAGTNANQLYQVTALAYGGNAYSVAVVQSTFQIGCLICSKGD